MKKLFVLVCVTLLPVSAFAATYDLLAPIGSMTTGLTLSDYLQGMFQFLIGMAGILAVVMIVWCGIKLMGEPSAGGKSEAKQCITNAILGLVLAASAWIILSTINAQLISSDLNLGNAPTLPITPPASPPAGTYSWTAVAGPCPAVAGKIVTVVVPALCTPPPIPFVGALCCSYADSPLTPPAPFGSPLPIPGASGPPPPATTVTFTPPTYSVNEGVGMITLTVTRSSGVGAGTVSYATTDNTTNPGTDFTAASGVLVFPVGITVKTITIIITNDLIVEGEETFSVALSAPTGAIGLGAASAAVVKIVDNDVPPPPPPPDILPPSIVINAPVTGQATTTSPIMVKYTFSDNIKVDTVSFTYAPPAPGVAFTKSICGPLGVPMLCPQVPTTLFESVPLDLTVYGIHQVTVSVCDGTNCKTATMDITVQEPCANTAILTCKVLPIGLDPVFPLCAPTNGTSGSFVGLNTDAYKFKITAATGGGKVYVAGGFNNEYPPQHPLEARSCVPSLCDTFPLDGSCTCVYGTASYDWEGSYLGCSNDVPENLVVSISDFPGDLSSTPASVSDGFKTVSGNCGSAGTGAKQTWGTTISTTLVGPGICNVQANRDYYVNISTLPFSAASKGANEYSIFWDYQPN